MTDETNDAQGASADEAEKVQDQNVDAISDRNDEAEKAEEGLENSLYKDDENSKENKDEATDDKPADESSEDEVDSEDLLGVEPEAKEDDKGDSDSDTKDDQESGEADDKDDDKGDDVEKKSPEDYKLELTKDSLLGVDAAKEVQEFAAKHNISQEAAEDALALRESAVEEYQKYLDDTVDERSKETVDTNRRTWFEQSKNDPEIGGDNYPKFVAAGNRLIKANASPEFIKILKVSGIGNHPEFIRFIGKAGMPMLDDSFDKGGKQVEGEVELEDAMYTTMK